MTRHGDDDIPFLSRQEMRLIWHQGVPCLITYDYILLRSTSTRFLVLLIYCVHSDAYVVSWTALREHAVSYHSSATQVVRRCRSTYSFDLSCCCWCSLEAKMFPPKMLLLNSSQVNSVVSELQKWLLIRISTRQQLCKKNPPFISITHWKKKKGTRQDLSRRYY